MRVQVRVGAEAKVGATVGVEVRVRPHPPHQRPLPRRALYPVPPGMPPTTPPTAMPPTLPPAAPPPRRFTLAVLSLEVAASGLVAATL